MIHLCSCGERNRRRRTVASPGFAVRHRGVDAHTVHQWPRMGYSQAVSYTPWGRCETAGRGRCRSEPRAPAVFAGGKDDLGCTGAATEVSAGAPSNIRWTRTEPAHVGSWPQCEPSRSSWPNVGFIVATSPGEEDAAAASSRNVIEIAGALGATRRRLAPRSRKAA